MTSYKLPRIAELAHQLRLSPARLRLQQLIGADHLLDLIEPTRFYPYSWVCWHITGYRAAMSEPDPADLRGAALIHDLLVLCEQLSRLNPIPRFGGPWPLWPIKELSERLNVSPKTIARWRAKGGLAIWWTVLPTGERRLAVPEKALRRFVLAHRRIVLRCRRFSQLSREQREMILERAGQLHCQGYDSIHRICQTIGAESGRAVETIRNVLRRHEAQWSDPLAGRPVVPLDEHQVIHRCFEQGDSIESLARRFAKTARTVRRIILHQRRRRLLARKIDFVYSPEFDLPDAEALLLDDRQAEPRPSRARQVLGAPPDSFGPVYLLAVGAEPPLAPERERALFRRYNYCKFRLSQLVRQLRCGCDGKRLEQAETWLERAESLRARLIETNLRLVISIAKRHAQPGISLEELVSEGNLILMRAVEKFDYTRGFKFSTYSSWAILKHYARIVPQWLNTRRVQRTGCDQVIELAGAHEQVGDGIDRQLLGGLLRNLLEELPRRERKVIEWHYGLLADVPARPLWQIAAQLGLSSEGVRQIERRGLTKLKALLADRRLQDLASA